ncbi:PAS domain-containing sensor histidine kinase, partial [Fulvivirga sp. RKSG066]|uniref:sensor histidine kinase n=1 Tax=Fulvivirga aurantia TaxID=2529383 RepID=UPI0012BC8864
MDDLVSIEELYENAPCGYFSFTPDGKLIRANKTFLNWIGIAKDELQRLKFLDILHKGNTIYYEMIFMPTLKMQGHINEISFDIIKKDGSRFPGLINAVAVFNENKGIKAVNVTLLDITERKKYERELLKAKERADNERLMFEVLANQIPDIIWTATEEGKIDFLNRQYYKKTNTKPADAERIFISDLISEKDMGSFRDQWEDARKHSHAFEMEVRLRNDSQNTNWYLLRGIPYERDRFSEKKELSWLGTLTNINHQIQSLQLKDEFIAIASHELKTPLTIIKSYLQVLNDVVGDDTQKTLLSKCESGVNSMSRMITNLLDITNLNSSELPIVRKKEELVEIARNSISDHQSPNSNHEILLKAELEKVFVHVDAMRIGQVITNLLSNAIKYSPGADKVILKIEKVSDDRVKLSVQDFGLGISQEDFAHIFDRYFRVKAHSSTYVQGWGLGLYIIQQIAKAHNSEIKVESEVGKGSVFSFELNII